MNCFRLGLCGMPVDESRDWFGCVKRNEVPYNILVTGGAGFVGSHLVDRLMLEGHCVTVIDNCSTGSAENLAQWADHPSFSLTVHDVRLPFQTERKFDQIYHLACPASPLHYQKDQKGTLTTCFFGTLHMLTLAAEHGARLFVASTSEVYGDPAEHPQRESYFGHVNTLGPRACYDEGKRSAETLCYTYSDSVDCRIGRIFNTYGPRMSPQDGRVVSSFITAALANEDLVIYGDGLITRSFQYVDDLIDGIVAFMRVDSKSRPLVLNLGNPEERQIIQLAQAIVHQTRSASSIRYDAKVPDDPQRRRPDITLASALLEWAPKTFIEDGLRHTIQYFREVCGRRT